MTLLFKNCTFHMTFDVCNAKNIQLNFKKYGCEQILYYNTIFCRKPVQRQMCCFFDCYDENVNVEKHSNRSF